MDFSNLFNVIAKLCEVLKKIEDVGTFVEQIQGLAESFKTAFKKN